MNDLRELGKLLKKNPIIIVSTMTAMVIGAIFGIIAYYNGWLG